jgi:hypothetical protein
VSNGTLLVNGSLNAASPLPGGHGIFEQVRLGWPGWVVAGSGSVGHPWTV